MNLHHTPHLITHTQTNCAQFNIDCGASIAYTHRPCGMETQMVNKLDNKSAQKFAFVNYYMNVCTLGDGAKKSCRPIYIRDVEHTANVRCPCLVLMQWYWAYCMCWLCAAIVSSNDGNTFLFYCMSDAIFFLLVCLLAGLPAASVLFLFQQTIEFLNIFLFSLSDKIKLIRNLFFFFSVGVARIWVLFTWFYFIYLYNLFG